MRLFIAKNRIVLLNCTCELILIKGENYENNEKDFTQRFYPHRIVGSSFNHRHSCSCGGASIPESCYEGAYQ